MKEKKIATDFVDHDLKQKEIANMKNTNLAIVVKQKVELKMINLSHR